MGYYFSDVRNVCGSSCTSRSTLPVPASTHLVGRAGKIHVCVDCASGLCLVRAKPYSCSDDCGDGNASEVVERIVQIIVSITIAATCFILLPNAYKIFLSQSKLKAVTLGISLGIEYIAAPMGIFMMAVQWTVDALYAIFDWPGYQARYVKEEQ